MKNYVGRKIRGFKLESFGDVPYIPFLMDNYIGQESIIKSQCDNFITIEFKNGDWFRCPISMVEEHLLPEELELPKKGNWKPIPKKVVLTKQEIAEKFGINIEQLEIIE